MPKLAQQPLTELAIKKAKPADKRYDLFDASVRGWAFGWQRLELKAGL